MTDPNIVAGSPEDLDIDHEQYAGEVLPDPWDDVAQTDWPNSPAIVDPDVDDEAEDDDEEAAA